MTIHVIVGDITKLHVDAIVNAANGTLLGGGGVDGAIHAASGSKLAEYCHRSFSTDLRSGNRCATGHAVITPGFNLPAEYVIHTVGPVWHGGKAGEAVLLASCYYRSMKLAEDNGIRSIAFPAISCGVYGFPAHEAASIAIQALKAYDLQLNGNVDITICCFDDGMKGIYTEAMNRFHIDELL